MANQAGKSQLTIAVELWVVENGFVAKLKAELEKTQQAIS